ncbi:hypothetical protein H6P81_017461 [Aristolochia fimbriata]|uniref:Uncharacterized protein n=1 Tax=Aristolochia fimbriata TaxID=158543 RepID=A0AAV7DYE1_ARIFI|nr:hypothetical protein H6P81_017461 [Aristolochia fimbriata]
MGYPWLLLCFLCLAPHLPEVTAWKASCKNPYYGKCYGIPHNCPPGCPRLCEVDCRICKPYCPCDRPGAVCQDPRFIGGDGVLFYFHGKKDRNFCLVSDSNIHVNGHFIGKRSKKGRDFTWVQAIGILFGSHRLYLGAKEVGKWDDSSDNLLIQLNGNYISIAARAGETWWSPEVGLRIRRTSDSNVVVIEARELFNIAARVVPITEEDSRVHGYDIAHDNCFAHLELNFKFNLFSAKVNGVLGQTYSHGYRSRVKMAAAMPIMGGAKKFASSHIFATDCSVSNFGSKAAEVDGGKPLSIVCNGGGTSGQGIVCKR